MIRLILCLSLYFMALVDFSYAQSDEKKRTVINFEDELIEGDVTKPELSYLLQKKQFNFGKLIRLRENFLPEMKSTAEKLERGH